MEFTERYRHIRRGGTSILINKRVAHDELIDLLSDPDRLWDHGGLVTDHLGKNRIGHGTLPVGLSKHDVFIKEFLPKSFLHNLTGIVRVSRAKRSFRAGIEMQRRDLPTPEPLASVTVRKFGVVQRDIIITEYLPNAVSVRALRDHPERHSDILSTWDQGQFLDALGQLLRRMADAQVCHRDLSLRNIMVQRPGENPPPSPPLVVIDLNRVLTLSKKQWKLTHSGRNFQRFRVSPEEFDRVLRSHFPDEESYRAGHETIERMRERHLMVKRTKKRVRGGGNGSESTPQT